MLNFVYEKVFDGSSESANYYTVKNVDGGNVVCLDSPCGVKAQIFETDFALWDVIGDDENDAASVEAEEMDEDDDDSDLEDFVDEDFVEKE